jgi:ankyrin repeat protein
MVSAMVCAQVVITYQHLTSLIATAIATGERPNQVEADVSDDGSEAEVEEQSEFKELLLLVHDSIAALFRLSVIIQNATPRDRFSKALTKNTLPFDETYDIAHVGHKFPLLDVPDLQWLKQRLGRAITQRRQFLRYARNHRDKKSKEEQENVAEDSLPANTSLPRGPIPVPASVYHAESVSGKPPSTLDRTTASTLVITKLEEIDNVSETAQTETSFATSLADDDEHKVIEVIPLSKVRKDNAAFECPYCWTIQTIKKQSAWKRHVMADLRAYCCTSKACDLKLFPDRKSWIDHEIHAHRVQWQCTLCTRPPFDSEASMKRHLANEHTGSVHESALNTIVQACRRTRNQISPRDCPFCDDWYRTMVAANKSVLNAGQELVVTPAQFSKHVGSHMEQLALFAVPRGDEEPGDGGSADVAAGSQSTNSDYLQNFKSTGVVGPTQENEEEDDEEVENPLVFAASEGLLDDAKQLVEAGMDVDATGKGRETALHAAVRNGDSSFIRFLGEKGADANKTTTVGQTALHLACERAPESTDILQLLLSMGADPNIVGYASPLHLATQRGYKQSANILLGNKADQWRAVDTKGRTPLHWAAHHNDPGMIDLLVSHGANINVQDIHRSTPLHLALARPGAVDFAAVKLLLSLGSSLEIVDENYQSPLVIAVERQLNNCVELLLERGANPIAWRADGGNALHQAIVDNNEDLVRLLLKYIGKDGTWTAACKSWDSLLTAVEKGNDQLTRLLLGFGLHPDDYVKNGKTALHIAAQAGRLDIAEMLLEHGANPDSSDADGETAVSLAKAAGHERAASVLLSHVDGTILPKRNQDRSTGKEQGEIHSTTSSASIASHISGSTESFELLGQAADVTSSSTSTRQATRDRPSEESSIKPDTPSQTPQRTGELHREFADGPGHSGAGASVSSKGRAKGQDDDTLRESENKAQLSHVGVYYDLIHFHTDPRKERAMNTLMYAIINKTQKPRRSRKGVMYSFKDVVIYVAKIMRLCKSCNRILDDPNRQAAMSKAWQEITRSGTGHFSWTPKRGQAGFGPPRVPASRTLPRRPPAKISPTAEAGDTSIGIAGNALQYGCLAERCTERFISKGDMIRHCRRNHGMLDAGDGLLQEFCCPDLGCERNMRGFLRFAHLRSHCREAHGNLHLQSHLPESTILRGYTIAPPPPFPGAAWDWQHVRVIPMDGAAQEQLAVMVEREQSRGHDPENMYYNNDANSLKSKHVELFLSIQRLADHGYGISWKKAMVKQIKSTGDGDSAAYSIQLILRRERSGPSAPNVTDPKPLLEVLHDYDIDDTGFSFRRGEQLELLSYSGNGWYRGRNDLGEGSFPATYVKILEPLDDNKVPGTEHGDTPMVHSSTVGVDSIDSTASDITLPTRVSHKEIDPVFLSQREIVWEEDPADLRYAIIKDHVDPRTLDELREQTRRHRETRMKDQDVQMLEGQRERPHKCPVFMCEYHVKGFAREYDQRRHTLNHYKGTMVCSFCPGSGSPKEKIFNRADVFKRHLTSCHGTQQLSKDERHGTTPINKGRQFEASKSPGICPVCVTFSGTAQDLHDHLDLCVSSTLASLSEPTRISPGESLGGSRQEIDTDHQDLQMLIQQRERPMTCPFDDCEHHTQGFVRTKDWRRHVLTHYNGKIVCNFCPQNSAAIETTCDRVDVFKRHLVNAHGVKPISSENQQEATTTNEEKRPDTEENSGKCSICGKLFETAQKLYDHLDFCVFNTLGLLSELTRASTERSLAGSHQEETLTNELEKDRAQQPPSNELEVTTTEGENWVWPPDPSSNDHGGAWISNKLPRERLFRDKLVERMETVLSTRGTRLEYKDPTVRRSFARALNALKDPEYEKRAERDRKVESLILLFHDGTLADARKSESITDASSNHIVNRQVALFARLVSSVLRDNGWADARPAVMSRLADLEAGLLVSDRDLVIEGDGDRQGEAEEGGPQSDA